MRPLLLALTAMMLAAAPAGLRPGLWAMSSSPGQATMDGRPLGDLPYTPPAMPDRQCLTAAAVRDPVALVARQVPEGCVIVRRAVTATRATLTGTCRPQAAGLTGGRFNLVGEWTPTSYVVRFTTENPSENGRMGFSGTVSGRRVGGCAPGS